MVSVCATCKGLQKYPHGLNGAQDSSTESLVWVNTRLPTLRSSSNACRACALLLNGILPYCDRFAGVAEDRIRVTAESFNSKPDRTLQDHLSVELRWKDNEDHDECQNETHENTTGYADLKLEFFTDGGMHRSVWYMAFVFKITCCSFADFAEMYVLTSVQMVNLLSLPLEEVGN